MKKNGLILGLIIAIAVFVRLVNLNLEPLSIEQKGSVILSAAVGVLSVIGIYLLVRELFDEKFALISSFLIAVSSWHVLISKIGTKDIFASFALIFTFYFIWHGLRRDQTFNFFLAGLFCGAGFYAGKEYFVVPFVILIVFLNYWDYVKKDFPLSKYHKIKTSILGGF